jgi:uncharacterized membrane protein YccC
LALFFALLLLRAFFAVELLALFFAVLLLRAFFAEELDAWLLLAPLDFAVAAWVKFANGKLTTLMATATMVMPSNLHAFMGSLSKGELCNYFPIQTER